MPCAYILHPGSQSPQACAMQEDAQDVVELMQACLLDETGLHCDPSNFGGRARKGKQVRHSGPNKAAARLKVQPSMVSSLAWDGCHHVCTGSG